MILIYFIIIYLYIYYFFIKKKFKAYGSLNNVFIYDSNFNFIQKLTVDGSHENANTLAFNENGKVCF